MLTEIKVNNFKCFKEDVVFPVGKLTLLTGVNGKGKSTVVQTLLLIAQSLHESGEYSTLHLNSFLADLGSFDDIRSTGSSSSSTISFRLLFEKNDKYLYWDTKFSRSYLDEKSGSVENEGILNLDSSHISGSDIENSDIGTLNLKKYLERIDTNPLKEYVSNFEELSFISADRMGPKTFHESKLNSLFSVGKNGENTALTIYKYRELEVIESLRLDVGTTVLLADQVSAWVSYIFNSGTINIESISETLKKIEISPDGSIHNYKPENVGYGFSYCLPIIVAGLTSKPGDILIVENPEAHLHPSAQNRITKFLCRLASAGITTIVETHSPSILNGVRLSIKDNILNSSDTSVLFFGENSASEDQVERIIIEDGGVVNHWPKGFFDQDEIDLDNLYGL
ncbi:hypothetical protein MACH09_10420 [Vibrio sp. MACH09]|uniref:AAA family ATPase n=1 Tax=Vibrio sp. MACH09 TaxID=3025122 RepID=UPI0027907ADD|nr:DUF3696 domain-containing protein [Vibrio sp. MACH09]GLO60534.1 hypothetical protein MACH09_10420 [Vibrio sp. MACH09]